MIKRLNTYIIAFFAIISLQCCAAKDEQPSSELISQEIQKKADERIKRIAIEDADELISNESDNKLLEETLLKIKAKEGALREKGLTATADLYMSIIKEIIIDSSPSISAELGFQ
jgi:hypothetical protein